MEIFRYHSLSASYRFTALRNISEIFYKMLVFVGLTFLFALCTAVAIHRAIFSNSKKGYWKKYGIREIDASHVVSDLDILLGHRDITERDDYVYHLLGDSEKFCGTLEKPNPAILIKDLDLIKKILIKNFEHFVDRRQFFGAAREDSVLRKMLGNLRGDEWKGVRSSVSPTFTTGKIRRMMEGVNSVGMNWIKELSSRAEKDGQLKLDVFNCASTYTVDVIASAIFGLQPETVQNPKSVFATMAHRLTDMDSFQRFKFTLSLRFPKAFQLFNIDILDMEALRFFEKILKQNLQGRMTGERVRNDFLQLLAEAKKGELRSHGLDELSEFETEAQLTDGTSKLANKPQFLTDHVMSGQCLSFFFAGFRTTSSFITFAIYALTAYKDVQEKLRQEVDTIFKEGSSGPLDYDELCRLVYMDMVLCEILRKYPATLRLERECAADFHDPETGLFVPKGTMVGIPLNAIHNDKQYYDSPDAFDPEHFRPDKRAKRNPYAFLPFGSGPRSCIGIRFALVESKAALAYLVRNFVLEPTQNTPIPMTGKRTNFQIVPPENLEVLLLPRKF